MALRPTGSASGESAVSGAFLLLFGAFTHAIDAYSTGVKIPYAGRTMAQQQLPALHICLIHPAGYLHADALLDPAQYFYWQFSRLGLRVSLARNVLRHDAVNFIFGAHNGFDVRALQTHSCIIVNLEQIGQGGATLGSDYLRLLKSAVVVDYNPNNPPAYTNHPEDVPLVSFGHAGWMKPGPHDALPLEERPLDLLFIGSVNQRRLSLLQRIDATGRKVHLQARPVYGFARNSMVRQAKGLLNLHFYDAARFEQVRAFMGLSLGTPVVSERLPNTSAGTVFDTCVTWFEDEQLEAFFENEFASSLYYDVSRQQLDVFETVDPIGEYADLVGFANGVWQAHLRTLPARAGEDRLIGPRMPLPWVPEVARRVMVVGHEPEQGDAAAYNADTSHADPTFPGNKDESRNHDRTPTEGDRNHDAGVNDAEHPAPLFQMMTDLCHDIDQLLAAGQLNEATLLMAQGVVNHFTQPGITEYSLYYPILDGRIRQLAHKLELERTTPSPEKGPVRRNAKTEWRKEFTLLVATDIYESTGGHSRVLEELARNLPNPVLVLTDLFGRISTAGPQELKWMHKRFGNGNIITLSPGTLWEKAHQLADICNRYLPDSIWYMTHHQDPVAFIGSMADSATSTRRYFVHHADHNPALGCTLPGIHHVDVTESMQRNCSCHLHTQASWLPLYAQDHGARTPLPITADRPFSAVIAGREDKFALCGPVALQSVVSAVLRHIDGNFHHIGTLNADTVRLVTAQLESDGIDPARWVHHGQVPSLWKTLKQIDAHVYIGSAPMSGGRGAVEAQGAGYPVLPFSGFGPHSLLADYSSYADMSLSWRNIEELINRLLGIRSSLQEHSLRARTFYETRFSKEVFLRKLEELRHTDTAQGKTLHV